MAARSTWSGSIPLAGLLTAYVEVVKATEKYAGDEPLKQVCACHHTPFKRTEACVVSGLQRLTEEKQKAGESGTPMVVAAERPDGTFAPLAADAISAISAAVSSEELEPLALLDERAWEWQTVSDLYYLRPAKKVSGSMTAVAGLYAYLADRKRALVCRWSTRGKQNIVAISATNGALCMNRLRYAQEVREPEDLVRAVAKEQVPEKAVALMDTLLDELPDSFDISQVEDESVTRKAAAIQAVLSGKPVATTEVTATPATPVPDLMAALESAIAEKGTKPKAKKAAARKDKVTT